MSVENGWQTLAGERWMTLNEALKQAESYDQGALALLKTLITTVETCISEATQGPVSYTHLTLPTNREV